jgi:para-nitrobenzyl esterase
MLKQLLAPILLVSLGILSACSDGGDNVGTPVETASPPPTIELVLSTSPIDLSGTSANFAADVAYGDGERNVLDVYMPDSDQPTPLVIYIHGGAFLGGDKSSAHENFSDDIRAILQEGVAYATFNYHLLSLDPLDPDGSIRSLTDSARGLQFMRYYAASFNIDPENVAIYGVSAGAGTGLWLGTHDDLADPDNADPVLTQSTRIKAVAALATQSTYNIMRWSEVLEPVIAPLAPILGGTDILTIANAVGQVDLLLAFNGLTDTAQLESPENLEYRANVDMLALMDSGDAPIFVRNSTPSPLDLVDFLFHHGLHGLALRDRAVEVGLANVVYVTDSAFSIEDPSGEDRISFMLRHIR